jgi:signal transduction histidine kinase
MRDIEFVAPDDRDYRLNYQARKSEGRKEMSGITKAGEIRHFEAFAKNVMWQGKEARLLTLFDITEKKIAEEHLRHAQKMEAVGELTGGIAHDFNNLLSVIMGNTEILESSVPESDEAARLNLANILRAAQGGADLTRRLLAFARRQPLRAERTDIHDLVDSLHSLFGHTIGKANELTTLFEEEQMIARVDPAQLENVLLNLAVNARDAMPEGGRITIRCSRASVIEVPDSTDDGPDPGDYIRIEVSDTGTGIPADIIDRVFDPFFTTKEVGKGTGLGLSMVFGFAKQSGGHVSISSRAGKGSTITLLVPKAT